MQYDSIVAGAGIYGCALSNGSRSQNARYYINATISLSSDHFVPDFIPVRQGKVGYMYDKVSRKMFHAKGAGDLVLGPDKR